MTIKRREFVKNAAAVGAVFSVGAGFLRPLAGRVARLRPPGAAREDEFLSRCIRCGQCADACPNQCIVAMTKRNGKPFSIRPAKADQSTPVIFPRQQACNLCRSDKGDKLLCTAACPTGALQTVRKEPEEIQSKVRMGRAELDLNLCYSYNGSSCGVCVRACPFERKALRAGMLERPILNASYCVGCGLCERACVRYPQAITVVPV